jgi:hypothetical protein
MGIRKTQKNEVQESVLKQPKGDGGPEENVAYTRNL